MIKNAFLSIKKSIGKTILLFLLMCLIANLVVAGLSIMSATSKSMNQVRKSLGSEVTFSYNMQNMMQNREKGQALDEVVSNITVDMADQLKDLEYVESYNYTLSVSASSDDIEPIAVTQQDETEDETQTQDRQMLDDQDSSQPRMMDEDDFTIVGNTTMAYLEDFTNENYVLIEGRLLTEEDAGTANCVIESNLATDNDLAVNDTFTVTVIDADNEETSLILTVVGIFEIETSSEVGGMMSNRQNPMNYIYTDLQSVQTLNGDSNVIDSATYYLDDPEHIDAFKELAQKTDIDFETYTLDANDQVYQRSIASLENMESFATIFLWVVIVAGSAILCLILVLTMRSRFYEFGVLLSLGQAKIKIMLQQLIEIGIIAVLAFVVSLGTGKMVSNVVSSMLESTQSNQNTVMMEMPSVDIEEENQESDGEQKGLLDIVMQSPTDTELDVSLTTETTLQLAGITTMICVISVALPSLYILRLSPREILVKKEG